MHQPLRRKINTQLNKGEHLHALRSWLWFGGDGVLRRKQEEAQQEVVGCLNLLTNAVVVWNTVYMQEVITQLRAKDYLVQDEDLVHLSPARFEHINRLSKYTFADQQALLANGLRPLRQPEHAFAAATSPPYRNFSPRWILLANWSSNHCWRTQSLESGPTGLS